MRQSKKKESVFTEKDEDVENNTLRFKLSGFNFIGNKVIDDNQLLRVTQKFLNKNVSFQELKSIIDLIEQKYDQAGWLVKISLPPQDITNGIVKLVILDLNYHQLSNLAIHLILHFLWDHLMIFLAPSFFCSY